MAQAPCLSCAVKPANSRGLCTVCYERARQLGISKQYPDCGAVSVPYRIYRHHGPCLGCGRSGRHYAHGLCEPCYQRAKGQGTVDQYPACGAVPVPYCGLGILGRTRRLRAYPNQPAIIGAPQHSAWQACVAWESRPQRWSTLRPAERRSA